MAPTELPDHHISAFGESVADVDGMIASLDVVLPILFVFSSHGLGIR